MIRVVVQTTDAGAAASVGGPVNTTIRTFLIDAPELERYLSEPMNTYSHRQIIGHETEDAT